MNHPPAAPQTRAASPPLPDGDRQPAACCDKPPPPLPCGLSRPGPAGPPRSTPRPDKGDFASGAGGARRLVGQYLPRDARMGRGGGRLSRGLPAEARPRRPALCNRRRGAGGGPRQAGRPARPGVARRRWRRGCREPARRGAERSAPLPRRAVPRRPSVSGEGGSARLGSPLPAPSPARGEPPAAAAALSLWPRLPLHRRGDARCAATAEEVAAAVA